MLFNRSSNCILLYSKPFFPTGKDVCCLHIAHVYMHIWCTPVRIVSSSNGLGWLEILRNKCHLLLRVRKKWKDTHKISLQMLGVLLKACIKITHVCTIKQKQNTGIYYNKYSTWTCVLYDWSVVNIDHNTIFIHIIDYTTWVCNYSSKRYMYMNTLSDTCHELLVPAIAV